MGTRCLTYVYDDDDKQIINLYRQYDGYMSGHGKELATILASKTVVNGLVLGSDYSKFANGMGCLAAQIVSHFKTGAGGFYLYPVTETDCGQDFEYHVFHDIVIVKDAWDKEILFNGTWEEFLLVNFKEYDE